MGGYDMRSLKSYIGSRNKYYGRKFYFNDFDSGTDYSVLYTIGRIPDVIRGYDIINDNEYVWVSWDNPYALSGGTYYTWEALERNIKEGVWVLI